MADVLESMYTLGCLRDEETHKISERFKVKVTRWRGSQKSPFQHESDGKYYGYQSGDCDILVKRVSDGKAYFFGHLLIDVIRYNGFFEGD